MKHTMKKTAIALAAVTMLCGTAAVLPDTGILSSANAITACAYSYNDSIQKTIDTNSRYFNWPFEKPNENNANCISSCFDEKLAIRNYKPHGAVDIAANRGTPVRAVASGTVIAADPDNGSDWGNHIIVEHRFNNIVIYSQYSHLQDMYVKKGDLINSTTKIGTVGGSGSRGAYTYGAHLDLQISLNNPANLSGGYQRQAMTIDPLKVMKLPATLVNQSGNTQEVGAYIYDRMNVDRCPSQLKYSQNLTHERTLTCRLSPHKIGRKDSNVWSARVSDGAGWMVYGPYETYSVGNKTVKFRLKEDINTNDLYKRPNGYFNDSVVCTVDIFDSTAQKVLKRAEIRRSDFLFSNTYQDFCFDFRNNYSNHKLEFRIYYNKSAALWADTISLYKK